jgi:hypothetical protein
MVSFLDFGVESMVDSYGWVVKHSFATNLVDTFIRKICIIIYLCNIYSCVSTRVINSLEYVDYENYVKRGGLKLKEFVYNHVS